MSDFYDMLHAQAAARRAEEENARLRVEIDFRSERMHAAEQERDRLRAELLTAAEKHKALGDAHAKEWEAAAKAEAEANKLRAELADLKACDGPIEQGKAYEAHLQTELDAAHAELAALKAAPSDAEIEAWRRGAARYLGKAWKHINGGEPVNRPEGIPSEGRRMMDEAVALMRRAKQAAPAPRDDELQALLNDYRLHHGRPNPGPAYRLVEALARKAGGVT